jgi:AhpD family alkylhydroperoxidase
VYTASTADGCGVMEAACETNDSGSGERAARGAPPNQPGKARRTLTIGTCFTTLGKVFASGPALVSALLRPKTSAALREKVFLGVTSINDCRYCSWGHSHWARAHGVSLEEINQILSQQIESLQARNPAEAAAILFAQHYAEQLGRFDPQAIENLRQYYDDGQVREILGYVRIITFGNLLGNTLEDVLDRFQRRGRVISRQARRH